VIDPEEIEWAFSRAGTDDDCQGYATIRELVAERDAALAKLAVVEELAQRWEERASTRWPPQSAGAWVGEQIRCCAVELRAALAQPVGTQS